MEARKCMTQPLQNQINQEKLTLSKWTAVTPTHKEKHFLVVRVLRDEEEVITHCVLEAVINHREIEIDWRVLKDSSQWLLGWR